MANIAFMEAWRENKNFGKLIKVPKDMQKEQMSPNFKWHEAMCFCGCNQAFVYFPILNALEVIKEHLILKIQAGRGILLIANSWCRCKSHNAAVGGAPESDHLLTKGSRAVDIIALIKNYPEEGMYQQIPIPSFYAVVDELNLFNRIWAYPTFLHCAISEKGYNRWIGKSRSEGFSLTGVNRVEILERKDG